MAKNKTDKKLTRLQKFTLFFFQRPHKTAILCLALVFFGVASYTTLLKREGFPTINTPFALSQGTYLVNDASKVDKEVAGPLSEFLLKQSGVDSVLTQSFDNFYSAQIGYKEDVDSTKRSQELLEQVKSQKILPDSVNINLDAFKFGATERGDDLTIAFYAENPVDQKTLISKAEQASEFIKNKNLSLVSSVSIINPFEEAANPETGASELTQKSFERFGLGQNGKTQFFNSIVIGVTKVKDSDNIELDKQVQSAINELSKDPNFSSYKSQISYSPAPQIKLQISELQQTLLEGLLAVLVIGTIVIAFRAALLTVVSMVTVIAIVNGVLYLLGYSLNTITLFAIILGLSLIVDDTIIMVEALEKEKRRLKNAKDAVSVATRKVSRAMIAATLTASLSFVPILFVGGILGGFIRAIPVTIISALVLSLFVALIFIPLFARKLFFTEKELKNTKKDSANIIEAKIAEFIARPMFWAQHSKKRLSSVITGAVLLSFVFIGTGGYLFQKVTFNIFPPEKDANFIGINIDYKPGTDIDRAQEIAKEVEDIAVKEIGSEIVLADYYGFGNVRNAILSVQLTDYKDRDPKSPELVEKLKTQYKKYDGAVVTAAQVGAGPPSSPFTARISTAVDREKAAVLAGDIAEFLRQAELKRVDGSLAKIENVTDANTSVYTRADNKEFISVNAQFVDTDTTTLVTLAQSAVEKEFDAKKVESYGLPKDTISFNFGQETENQDSFKTLAIAFPVVLLAIYVLLALQFKSFLQPILIFMAIPFSLFGITLGLWITDNAFSFFAMLGFFALIGLSIKNTILLTDYANQARKAGMNPVHAAHEAISERFRPLVATSLTAVVSLIPLAITSPFWEGLSVVLIFGLLSSTLLVILVFPYYYLGAEFLRTKTGRLVRKLFKIKPKKA